MRLFARLARLFGGDEVIVDDLKSDSRGGFEIELLEPRIVPEQFIVNPPGGGHGTTLDPPAAANGGLTNAAGHSPAIQPAPPPPPPPGPPPAVRTI